MNSISLASLELRGVEKQKSLKASVSDAKLFANLLDASLKNSADEAFHISAHAQKRLGQRNISMSAELKESLSLAFADLAEKGGRDSLVLTEEGAFVVNVPNKTVVTAMKLDELQDGIVTNIDSISIRSLNAVFAQERRNLNPNNILRF